jgi:hypothetical protein
MKRVPTLTAVCLVVLGMLAPAARAAATSGDFLLFSEGSVGVAANGDMVFIDGEGEFSVMPNSITAAGMFTHTDPTGTIVRCHGSWTANAILGFNFYGCGSIPAIDLDLPDDECGGALKLDVTLSTPVGELPAILTIFCIIGPMAPANHNSPPGEGATLNVPGVINFSHAGGGDNVYLMV